MEIHLRCPGLLAGTECSVYGFVRKKGLLDGSRIGNCRTEEGKMDCLLETETMAVGHGKIPLWGNEWYGADPGKWRTLWHRMG